MDDLTLLDDESFAAELVAFAEWYNASGMNY